MTTYGEKAGPDDPDAKHIADLYVRCSYPLRPDVLAASDTCQHPADSGVKDDKGNVWWRCPAHRGELRLGVTGEVREYVILRSS